MKALVSLIALSLSVSAYSAASERLYAYTDAVPTEESWVGQQVIFSVVLAITERPQGSPRFSFPDVSGGILVEVSGRPTYGKEEKDGTEYSTWRYDFAFYPQRGGPHTIPPIGIRVSLPNGDGTWQQFTTATTSFNLKSKWPKGSEGLASLISTKRFDATEKWEPANANPRVGDAITRTISRSADEVLGLGFPPLGFAEIEGMGIYPESPEVKGQAYRGDITGERTEKIVYTFNREGPVTIPGHVIPWFDLGDQKMKYVRFPARTFEVAPNPGLLNTGVAAMPSNFDSSQWTKVLGTVVGLLLTAFVINRFIMPALANRQKRASNSESVVFKGLLQVCQEGDAMVVSNHLRMWLSLLDMPLEQCLTDLRCPILRDQMCLLNKQLYSKESNLSWSPDKLSQELRLWRKKILQDRHHQPSTNQSLPTLNPLYKL